MLKDRIISTKSPLPQRVQRESHCTENEEVQLLL